MKTKKDQLNATLLNEKSKCFEPDNEIVTLWKVITNKRVFHYCVFLLLFSIACYQSTPFMTGYAAMYFGGCNTIKKTENNNNCDMNYNKANLVTNGFRSALGIVSVFVSSFIGHLSDIYGRKPFFWLNLITHLLPFIPMIFYDNYWLYSCLFILQGLNGSCFILSSVLLAYLSDILPPKQCILAYGLSYLMMGTGLLIGLIIGIIISTKYNDHANFYIITGIFVLAGLYLHFFVVESLDESKRKINANKKTKISYNPFGPLLQIRKHPIVLWVSLVLMMISLPESGILDVAGNVYCDTLNADSSKCNLIVTCSFGALAFGMILTSSLLLPFLKNIIKITDYTLLISMTILMGISFVLAMSVSILTEFSFFIKLIVIICSSFILGVSLLAVTAGNNLTASNLIKSEKGIGFGILFSIRSLTFVISPFGFASLYTLSKSIGYVSFVFAIGVLMCIVALFMAICLLKPTLMYAKKHGIVYRYHTDINENGHNSKGNVQNDNSC